MSDLKTQMLLEAIDKMSGPLSQVQAQVDKLAAKEDKAAAAAKRMGQSHADAMEKIGKGAMVAGAAMTGAVGATLIAAAQLQDAQAAAMNAFGTDTGMDVHWAEINKQAIEAGNLYPGTTADFLELAAAEKMAGASSEMMAKGAFKGAAALQVMFHLNPAEGGRLFQEMANGMTVAGEDSLAFADVIQRASYSSGLSLAGMHDALTYVSAPLKMLKVEGLEASKSVMAMMGTLKLGGLQDSQVGTSLSQLLTHISSMGLKLQHGRGYLNKEAERLLSEKGINAADLGFFNKKGQFNGPEALLVGLDKIKKAFGEDSQGLMNTMKAIFGEEGMRAAMLLSVEAQNKMSEKMLHQEDIQKRLNRITEALGNKWESVQGSAVNALAAIGVTLTPYLVPVLNNLNSMLGKVVGLAEANPSLTAALVGVVGALGGLLLVGGSSIWMFGKLTTGVIEGFGALKTLGIVAETTKLSVGSLAIASGPLLIAAVALGAAAYVIYKNWDDVAPTFDRAAGSADDLVGSLGKLFTLRDDGQGVKKMNEDLKATAVIANGIGETINAITYGVRTVVELLDRLLSVDAGILGAGKGLLKFDAGIVKGAYGLVTGDHGKALGSAWREAKGVVPSIWKNQAAGWNGTLDALSGHMPGIGTGAQAWNDAALAAQSNEKSGNKFEEARVRRSMLHRLHEHHLDKAKVGAGGVTVGSLVGTLQVTGQIDEASFTKMLLDKVREKAPDLVRELQRQLKVNERGAYATQGAN